MVKYKQRNMKWFDEATPVNAKYAKVTLTVDTQTTIGDTMTIGTKVFTFVADTTEADDGDVSIGTNLATSQANIVAAINGTDSINTAIDNITAGAFATNDSVITYGLVGDEGNLIASTETFDTVTNILSSVTFAGGQYATRMAGAGYIIISGVWYLANEGVDKWSTDGWYSATPSQL